VEPSTFPSPTSRHRNENDNPSTVGGPTRASKTWHTLDGWKRSVTATPVCSVTLRWQYPGLGHETSTFPVGNEHRCLFLLGTRSRAPSQARPKVPGGCAYSSGG
jgi:hypothetical protein